MAKPVVLAAWEPEEPEEALAAQRILGRQVNLHWHHELTPDLRRDLLPNVDVLLVFGWPKDLTEHLPRMRRLRFLQRFPAGVETLPFAKLGRYCPKARIAGGSGPMAEAVAEHAWSLVLACAKRVALHDRLMRQGEFHQTDRPSVELAGKTLGLLGYGAIGRRVARIARAFGMKVLAVRRDAGSRPMPPVIGTLRQLPALLKASDVLVVALPLSRATDGLLGARELRNLRPPAILVNVARGRILDESAAYDYLSRHPDAYWGLDVWWHYPNGDEAFRQAHPFEALPNLVMTPHNAATVPAYRQRMVEFGCRNALRHLRGLLPKNLVEARDYLEG